MVKIILKRTPIFGGGPPYEYLIHDPEETGNGWTIFDEDEFKFALEIWKQAPIFVSKKYSMPIIVHKALEKRMAF